MLASYRGRWDSRSVCDVATIVNVESEGCIADSLSMTVLANARAFRLEVATPKLSIKIRDGPFLAISQAAFYLRIAITDPTDL